MKSDAIVIFLLIIIIILGLAFANWQKNDYNRHPKKIWTYWDNPDRIPKTVKMCMESWKKYNPEYEIILLTKQNFKGYVIIPEEISKHQSFNDSPQRFSDLIRLWTLAEHGGVWIDASTLLKASLDSWIFPRYAEFSGFYLEGFTTDTKYPVIASWFMACNKDSKFIKLWRDEFSEIGRYPNVEKYIEATKQVDTQKIPDHNSNTILIAAQKVFQIDKYPLDSLILKKAEDGPFKYLTETYWDSEKALRLACSDKKYQSPIMKMRGNERKVLEEHISHDMTPEICGWLD